ncbi:MAG: sulfatase-like hydrolase/transferase, partial [Planctomycetota bacterium]|nr:sulfatase-like hydrolase/transferase [Planctomycetota bacterium]
MKNWIVLLLCLVTLKTSARQPNVIFILADDLGYSELGCYGNDFNETPSLDKLSKLGMRFSDAYAAAPVCSPYRASLMTGLHPARVGILDYLRPNSAFAISPEQYTLPRAFQANGYTTGFIGKWHLTGYKYHNSEFEVRPTDVGFDTEIGGEIKGVGNGANFWPYVFRDQPIRWLDFKENKLGNDEYLVDRMNYEAVQFIESNQEKPFFLYLSHYSTHSILNGRPDKVKKYIAKHPPGPSSRDRCYLCQDSGHQGDALHHWAQHHNPHLAAMLESIDDGVGLIMDKLEELNLTNDTILI